MPSDSNASHAVSIFDAWIPSRRDSSPAVVGPNASIQPCIILRVDSSSEGAIPISPSGKCSSGFATAWGSNTRTTAIVLDTLTKLADPTVKESTLIPNVVRWLIVARRGDA